MAKLNEMIREFRESINQSVEALAMLLQLSPEEYTRLEESWNPPDPVLERICTLFEWNYQEIKRIALQGPFTGNEDPNEPVQEEPEQARHRSHQAFSGYQRGRYLALGSTRDRRWPCRRNRAQRQVCCRLRRLPWHGARTWQRA